MDVAQNTAVHARGARRRSGSRWVKTSLRRARRETRRNRRAVPPGFQTHEPGRPRVRAPRVPREGAVHGRRQGNHEGVPEARRVRRGDGTIVIPERGRRRGQGGRRAGFTRFVVVEGAAERAYQGPTELVGPARVHRPGCRAGQAAHREGAKVQAAESMVIGHRGGRDRDVPVRRGRGDDRDGGTGAG